MGDKLVIGPINKGLRNDRTAFVIDNDSFPTLINAYQWRGRIKRKRGTSLLGRLIRFFDSTSLSYSSTSTFALVAGAGNLFIGFGLNVNSPNASLIAGSIEITDTNTGEVYTDPGLDGILVGSLGGSGTINYSTGAFTIVGGAGHLVSANFLYYPDLPVMGLEEFLIDGTQFPGTIAFDTRFSYNISPLFPYPIWDVSFYKNPPVDPVNLPGYIQKTVVTPTTWNGQDYQQFWSVNYQDAMWVTNGITVPFSITNIGMQFKPITGMIITSATAPFGPSIVNLTIVAHGLSVGDFVFINEVQYSAPNLTNSINFQTGYVIAVLGPNNVSVEFPNAYLTGTYSSGGIAQYLTNRADTTLDGIRWYDGDPTDGNPTNPSLTGNKGWVNFAPPLSFAPFSIANTPEEQWYLAGARIILPFKDRLLFFGPVIQTSAAGSQVYLQDTVIYSQNGTPYYTASFTGDPSLSNTEFHPILTPQIGGLSSLFHQTATPTAWWEDQTGFGGFITAGVNQPINTAGSNEDVLIVGFTTIQTKLVYSGNDVVPFNFFLINSELGSGSTFSIINMDRVVLTRGTRGFIGTSQVEASRIDLPIPDQVFQIRLIENGSERLCSQRDFINEWIYFTYPSASDNYFGDNIRYKFPNQTLQYNYRDDSWAIFNECYTTYGSFSEKTGFTWSTVGNTFPTWNSWNEPWNAGSSQILQPKVIGGNQQGFVIFRDDGTEESNSLFIQNFSASLVTSPNHTLSEGDFIIISGVLGTIGSQVNGKIFLVSNPTINTFTLDPTISAGTYLGGGVIKRLYVPFVQTKQFPAAWDMARKTRIGVQRYLLTRTDHAEMQLLIFLSQDDANPYNDGPIIPQSNSQNTGLIYSTVLFTCPESTNLGLTPSNTNLQQLTLISGDVSANNQQQIWHRINTSLIGDTVQLGFTISDEQMRSLLDVGTIFSITGIALGTTTILTTTGQFSAGQLVKINNVIGTVQLNYEDNENILYNVLSSTPTTVTIEVDSTAFTPYISGGTVNQVFNFNQFGEIELHSIIMDISPSMELA